MQHDPAGDANMLPLTLSITVEVLSLKIKPQNTIYDLGDVLHVCHFKAGSFLFNRKMVSITLNNNR